MTKKSFFTKLIALLMTLTMAMSMLSFTAASDDIEDTPGVLRNTEYLTRGLVCARLPGTAGVFMSWRFLGNEPDGISWNIYRSDDGGATWAKIATIEPRDVEPESDYATNPGIVKENVTPTNYTDAAGTASSLYEVSPIIDGIEGLRQGMSVPMMTAGTGTSPGATFSVPYRTTGFGTYSAPRFLHRTTEHGPTNGTLAVIPRTGANAVSPWLRLATDNTSDYWWNRDTIHYVVDMDLFRSVREPQGKGAVVEQELVDDAIEKLNMYLGLLNRPLMDAALAETALDEDGKITKAFLDAFEMKFFEYVNWLDVGPQLPYSFNAAGTAINTTSLLTNTTVYRPHVLTVGDFLGIGEYQIVALMSSGGGSGADPYQNCTGVGGNSIVAPVFVDIYDLQGNLLFRVDCGPNVMNNNYHNPQMHVADFDGSGRASLIMRLSYGARVGNVDASGAVVYSDNPADYVGGAEGMKATREAITGYAQAGDADSLNKYWNMVNGWAISLHRPDRSTAELSPADINNGLQKWMKTYHVGYNGGNVPDMIAAFQLDPVTGKGILVDATPALATNYNNPNDPYYDRSLELFGIAPGSEEELRLQHWGVAPMDARGAYAYAALVPNQAGTSLVKNPAWRTFNRPNMHPHEVYWLENPWGYYPFGDPQGNRSSRGHGATAMLDGEGWWACIGRGYYHRTTFDAARLVDGKLDVVSFDSGDPQYWVLQAPNCLKPETCGSIANDGGPTFVREDYCNHCNGYLYQNRGNHQGASGDVDGDGKDEIVMVGMTLGLSADGKKILPKTIAGGIMPSLEVYAGTTTGPLSTDIYRSEDFAQNPDNEWWPLRHGDRGVLLPIDSSGRIVYWSSGEENFSEMLFSGKVNAVLPASRLWYAGTGEMAPSTFRAGGADWDTGTAGNFSNQWPGILTRTPNTNVAHSVSTGHDHLVRLNDFSGGPIWWTGNLLHQRLDTGTVSTVNSNLRLLSEADNTTARTWTTVYSGGGTGATKATAKLQLDMFGDWREEFINTNNTTNSFVIHTSVTLSDYGIRTLMHDPFYRQAVANKHVSYQQPPAAGFYLGDEAPLPAQRTDLDIPVTELVVTFLDEDGTELEVTRVLRNHAVKNPGISWYGYSLVWLLDGAAYDLSTPVTQDITLVAQWTLNQINYMRIADKDGNLSPQMIAMARGSSAQFTLDLEYDVIPFGVIWSVNNPNLASVDEFGLVTIKGQPGNVTLTARAPSGVTHSIVIRIT